MSKLDYDSKIKVKKLQKICISLFLIVSVIILAFFTLYLFAEFNKFHDIPLFVCGLFGGPLLLLLLYLRERNYFSIRLRESTLSFFCFWISLFLLLIPAVLILPVYKICYDYLTYLHLDCSSNFLLWFALIVGLLFFIFLLKEDLLDLKKYRPLTKKILVVIILLFFCPYFLNILFIPYHIEGFFFYDGTKEIQETALELTKDIPDNEDKVKALLSWQLTNLTDVFGKTLINKKPYIAIVRALNNPNLVMYYKHGVCGDFAVLLSELASASGIENRRVHAPGENHEWVEIKINESNNSWVNADAAYLWPQQKYIYNDFDAYGKVSRVYYVEPETNKQVDITKKYSKTGNLSVYLKSNVENATAFNIKVLKSGNLVVRGYPNSKGFFNYTLGNKRYAVIAEKCYLGGLIAYEDKNSSVFLTENETTMVVLEPQKSYLSSCIQ